MSAVMFILTRGMLEFLLETNWQGEKPTSVAGRRNGDFTRDETQFCASETSSPGDGLQFPPLSHRIPAAVSRLWTHWIGERWRLKARLAAKTHGRLKEPGAGSGRGTE